MSSKYSEIRKFSMLMLLITTQEGITVDILIILGFFEHVKLISSKHPKGIR